MSHALLAAAVSGPALREAVARGESPIFRVHGDSMRPSLAPGVRMRLVPTRHVDLRVGELAVCDNGGAVVLHRVVRVEPSELLTQGDACTAPDRPWPPHAVLGRAVSLSPLARSLGWPGGARLGAGLRWANGVRRRLSRWRNEDLPWLPMP